MSADVGAQVAPFELITGPAKVWIAPVGEAYPDVSAAPAGNWVSLGFTDGGVTIKILKKAVEHMVDQLLLPYKATHSAIGLEVQFTLAQLTLETMGRLLNGNAVTTHAIAGPYLVSQREVSLGMDWGAQRKAMLIRGPSPYGDFNVQWEPPVMYQSTEPTMVYMRDKQAGLQCQWHALSKDGTSVPTAQMGVIRAQDA